MYFTLQTFGHLRFYLFQIYSWEISTFPNVLQDFSYIVVLTCSEFTRGEN
jgi:hypothetical protein